MAQVVDDKQSISEHERSDNNAAAIAVAPTLQGGQNPIRMVSVVTDEMKNLVYVNEEEEPELHWRTYVALAALFMLNLVQLVALNGPSAILSYIGDDLHNAAQRNWIANALSLVQAVGGPLISFASDTFQARKTILVGLCSISVIGSAIAPGSTSIYRVVVAQILVGAGFAAVPLAYAIPSEIVPRKWRPVAQSFINLAATIGAVSGDLIAGYLTRLNAHTGWRNFYWMQTGLWGLTVISLFIGYRPPKRHTRLDHLSLTEKLKRLDLPGMGLLTAGLTLLLTGLSLGGNPWAWTNVRVLATLISGIALLIAFGIYQWRFTNTGIMHHELFRSRAFPLSLALIFVEGIMLFSIIIMFPAFTTALYETDPVFVGLRISAFWLCSGITTVFFGFWSSQRKTVRSPLVAGYCLLTAGLVGLACIQPGASTRSVIFVGMAGVGFAAPLILLVSLVQLSIPHGLIATGTAVLTSSRAVAASVFTAIYGATVNAQAAKWVPRLVPGAAIAAGLSPQYAGQFTAALANSDNAALAAIPGVNGRIIGAGVAALKQALANSFRIVYIIGASFGVLGIALCYFVPDISSLMHFGVDAPVEELHAKGHPQGPTAGTEKSQA